MASVRLKDRFYGASILNNWKEIIMDILEENDIYHYMISVVEDTCRNVGRTAYKKNQEKARRIIYDYVKGT